jgi:hypothetical protein
VLENFEHNVDESLKLDEQMSHEHAEKMKSVPKFKFNFTLGELSVTLLHDFDNGISLYNKRFEIDVMLFDTTNKYNARSIEINLKNEAFGLDVKS